jgi:hypothetical protein
VQFRRKLTFDPSINKASAVIAVDNSFVLFINDKKVAEGDGTFGKPMTLDLTKPLAGGGKVEIRIVATNADEKPNPAGVWFHLDAAYAKPPLDNKGRETGDLVSNAKWETSADGGKTWAAAVELGGTDVAPWKLADKLPSAWVVEPRGEVRAALLYADPLTTALGRPNREQVNTVRPTAATTLQMLELTNGATLTDRLRNGAEKLADDETLSAEELVKIVYARAFGRPPTPGELAIAKQTIGEEAKSEGIEDLLWAVMMLPEYQLIR